MGCLRVGPSTLLVVAEHGRGADWVRNALAAGSVSVWVEGRRYRGRVEPDPEEDPQEVLRRMRNPVHRGMIRAMAHEAEVMRVELLEPE